MIDVLDTLRASLAPHYDVEREIGAGGMARVFLAVEQHPHRRVAIKVLDPEVSTRLLRERFIREVDLSSKLSHPHIVPIFSAGEVDGLFYYVMPYVEGESLRHRLVRERKLPLAAALHITRDVADALAFAHAQGIIHRDIKPENILLSGERADPRRLRRPTGTESRAGLGGRRRTARRGRRGPAVAPSRPGAQRAPGRCGGDREPYR